MYTILALCLLHKHQCYSSGTSWMFGCFIENLHEMSFTHKKLVVHAARIVADQQLDLAQVLVAMVTVKLQNLS
jgi:hypothetical protein